MRIMSFFVCPNFWSVRIQAVMRALAPVSHFHFFVSHLRVAIEPRVLSSAR